LVFFDPNSVAIEDPRLLGNIRRAGEVALKNRLDLRVIGYTDTAEAPDHDQILSERRACRVAEILVDFGVPPRWLVVSGRGEKDQRVPTAVGVAEPQNRRVEITIAANDRTGVGSPPPSGRSGLMCDR
jgi:outer membrane protein OmpA-like peptidoglycan-associated protein